MCGEEKAFIWSPSLPETGDPMAQPLPPPLDASRDRLTIGGVPCERLADRFGTPLYVMHEGRIRANFRRLRDAFVARYPRTRILYAVKANPNLAVLRILREEGSWADVSGPGEIVIARAAGFRPSEILCTPSFPSGEEVAFAVRAGVTLNLDDVDRIPRAKSRRAAISLRVNPGFGRGGYRGIVTGGKRAKFGIPEREILRAYRRAVRMGYRHFGLHAMTGSHVLDEGHFPQVADALTCVAGRVSRDLGIRFDFIDLGGGLGIPYLPAESPLDIRRVAERTVNAFERGCDREQLGRPELRLEPGRYLVGDAGVLLARVTGIRHGLETFVGLDAGMSTLMRPALYGAYHEMIPVARPRRRVAGKVTLCGPICENSDVLARDRPFPRVRVGEVLAILNAGAYGYAMASNYNGRPRPPEILVRGRTAVLVREGETYHDLLLGQRLP